MRGAAHFPKAPPPASRGGIRTFARGAALWLLSALPAAAQGTAPLADILLPPLEMSEAGIYCPADHVAKEDAPDTESGYILLTEENPEMVLSSRVVPAYIGISFGIRIRLEPGAPLEPYVFTVHHPPVGPRQVTTESWNPALDSRWGVRSFNFEFDRELVTGTWTFEVSRDDVVLLRQSFEVVPPMQAPEAIDICFGNTFVS